MAVEELPVDSAVNVTDEEKEKMKTSYTSNSSQPNDSGRPFLDTVLEVMDCTENDYLALLALCLVYALANNKGEKIMHSFSVHAIFLSLSFSLSLSAR